VSLVQRRVGKALHALARQALWFVLVPVLRLRARRRSDRLTPGAVTVVTVNWNSTPYLSVLLRFVRRHSPSDTRILVVDNSSSDASLHLVLGDADVGVVRLPLNAGHDLALDIGFLLATTEFVVALDVDAFPLHNRWLDELLAPLRTGSEVSGARLNRMYVHPCCLAMRTARFAACGHSFRAHYRPRRNGQDASGDIGEKISEREQGRLHFFDPTSTRGPGDVGTVFGDLVYHNFYSTRFRATDARRLDGVVDISDPAAAWSEALSRYDHRVDEAPDATG
jgi:glycosyltransferase involved in cell wall biosynthesis